MYLYEIKNRIHVEVGLTEVEGHRRVVVCFTVSDEVDLVLPLLLLQSVFGAAMVANTAAAQNEDDSPHQPEPYGQRRISTGVPCSVGTTHRMHLYIQYIYVHVSYLHKHYQECCALYIYWPRINSIITESSKSILISAVKHR